MPTAHGIFFQNRQGSFEIRGQVIYRWIERLTPYLNGHYTLAEITQGLDPQRQIWVSNVLETLQARGFLKDVSEDRPHTLTSLEEKTYGPAIAYIDAFQDSAAYRFERFREQRVLVIGSGLTHATLVVALLQHGIRQLTVLTTQECPTNTQRYRAYLNLRHPSDPRQTLAEVADPDWQEESAISAVLEPFDVILHVSDRPMLERARRLNRLCVAQKKLLVQAMIVDTRAWIGPLTLESQKGCWECAWRRLQARAGEQEHSFQDHMASPISDCVALPTAALVANLLSFELFKHCTEAGAQEITGNVLRVDLSLAHIQKHPFLPHPLCSICSAPTPPERTAFLEHIRHLEQQTPLDRDIFLKQAATCFEDHLGLFSSLDPCGYAQLPLRVCRATLSSFPGLVGTQKPLLLAEASIRFYQAKQRLIQRACEIYAAHLVDQRKLVPLERAQGENIACQDGLLGGEDLPEVKQWVWALQLNTGLPCLVPASLAFPILHTRELQKETGPGIGSGMSWDEAICHALLGWCKHLTITQLDSRKEPYAQVDIHALFSHMKSIRMLYYLKNMRNNVTVYDVTGVFQVPTFAICVNDTIFAYSTHCDPFQAIAQGFTQMMQQFQAFRERQPEYALARVADLPKALRGDLAALPDYACPQEWPDLCQWLQEKLLQQGWRAFVVPLDHDPALATLFPFAVRVLLSLQHGE